MGKVQGPVGGDEIIRRERVGPATIIGARTEIRGAISYGNAAEAAVQKMPGPWVY